MALIKTIRQQAYPDSTATMYDDPAPTYQHDDNSAYASMPIFVMRPLGGGMEHSIQAVVQKIRADGDKAVFWVDTSGWLDSGDDFDDARQLSYSGNRKVALYMHAHLCRALSSEPDLCPFFKPEEYVGKVFVPSEDGFEHAMQASKEKKIRKLFWGHE